MNRRQALASIGTSIASTLAGCTEFGGADAPVESWRSTASVWPMSHFDPAGTGRNRAATGPSSSAETSTLVEASDFFGAPVVTGSSVFALRDDGVYAIDRQTGDYRWNVTAQAWFADGPTLLGETVLVPDFGGVLHAIEAETGRERWRFISGESLSRTTSVTTGSVVYTATTAAVYALDASDGTEWWRTGRADGSAVPTGLAYHAGRVFVSATDGRTGDVYAIDARTGRRQWTTSVGEVYMPPVVDPQSERLYVGTTDGTLYGIETETGAVDWTRELPLRLEVRPAVAGGSLYLPSHGGETLYAIDGATGETDWQATTGPAFCSPVVSERYVLAGTGSGVVHHLSADDGSQQARTTLTRPIQSVAVVDDLAVVIGQDPTGGSVTVLR